MDIINGSSAQCVSKKLRQGERSSAWQIQEFRNVSLGLRSPVGLQKAVSEEVKTQSAGSHNFCARHQKLYTPSRDSPLMSLMEWYLMDCIHTARITYPPEHGRFSKLPVENDPLPVQKLRHGLGFVWKSTSWPKAKPMPGAACCQAGYVCSVVFPNSSQLHITDAATGTN